MAHHRILFVCAGNICRSPLAEGIFRHLATEAGRGSEFEIDSAGTGGWHQGERPDRRSIAAAAGHGVDISGQRARRIEAADFDRFDLILAMDQDNLKNLRKIAPAMVSDVYRAFALAKTIIELKKADLTLGNAAASVHVLKGIDLTVAEGESVGIVGPSGSGKSTLLMVLAGLEKLDSGELLIRDTPLHSLSEDRVADFRGRNIGIVFQSFHLIANMTALENVAVPLELANVRDAFDIARRELQAVGLGERLSHYPGQLSGGEQQRVAIARALAPSPALLIADEPTGNLDTDTGRQIADLLFAQQAERGTTLLLVTHDPALAARCSRQIHVRSGEIEADSAPARTNQAAMA
jgi:putative ABC transport system ATP-binding protein